MPPTSSQLQRLGPRPLALHLMIEGWITQTSLAALPFLSGVSPNSKLAQLFPGLLERVLAESGSRSPSAGLDPLRFANAVADAGIEQVRQFVAGVTAYQAHPARRTLEAPPPIWQAGAATLRDYGTGGIGTPVLVVPSLINRSTVLDLMADRSLLRSMAAAGLRVFLLDWGAPGREEHGSTLDDYVGVIEAALAVVADRSHRRPSLMGYCMGGTLAVAAAVLRPALVESLVLLAAPWDFHGGSNAHALITLMKPQFEAVIAAAGEAPVDLLQALFAAIDPTLAGRKFRRFARLDPRSAEAEHFVLLEDWANDGVPLVAEVARTCLFAWYGDNAPARGTWRVQGELIDPRRIDVPALVVIPQKDRLVPPPSARALAQALPCAEVQEVPLGHVGMMVAASAPAVVYPRLIDWLKGREEASS